MSVDGQLADAVGMRLRPNPFAVLPDTTYRFALLIVAVFGLSLFLTAFLAQAWVYTVQPGQAAKDAELSCLPVPAHTATPVPYSGVDTAAIDRVNACLERLSSRREFGLGLIPRVP
jgi:hypothetical protein